MPWLSRVGLGLSRVFEATDRSLSRRPRGGCEARVRRGTRQCGTGASKPRSRNDDGGRLAPRLLGGFRPRGARFVWLMSGADGSLLAVCPCGFVFRGVRGARGAARWGGWGLAGLWGCCGSDDAGAWAGTLPCVKDQSGVDASRTIAARGSRYSHGTPSSNQPADPPNRDQTCR